LLSPAKAGRIQAGATLPNSRSPFRFCSGGEAADNASLAGPNAADAVGE
jgi:hypothetical protein